MMNAFGGTEKLKGFTEQTFDAAAAEIERLAARATSWCSSPMGPRGELPRALSNWRTGFQRSAVSTLQSLPIQPDQKNCTNAYRARRRCATPIT